MKKLHLFLFLSILGTIAFSSCKKEDQKSRTELLTSGTWKIVASTVTSGSVTIDNYEDIEACEKDNYLIFKTGGVMEMYEGATKCDPDDDQMSTGVWALLENETKVSIEGLAYTIVSLNGSELQLSTTQTGSGITATITVTLKH